MTLMRKLKNIIKWLLSKIFFFVNPNIENSEQKYVPKHKAAQYKPKPLPEYLPESKLELKPKKKKTVKTSSKKHTPESYKLNENDWVIANAYFEELKKGKMCYQSREFSSWTLKLYKLDPEFQEKREVIWKNLDISAIRNRVSRKTTDRTKERIIQAHVDFLENKHPNKTQAYKAYGLWSSTFTRRPATEQNEIIKIAEEQVKKNKEAKLKFESTPVPKKVKSIPLYQQELYISEGILPQPEKKEPIFKEEDKLFINKKKVKKVKKKRVYHSDAHNQKVFDKILKDVAKGDSVEDAYTKQGMNKTVYYRFRNEKDNASRMNQAKKLGYYALKNKHDSEFIEKGFTELKVKPEIPKPKENKINIKKEIFLHSENLGKLIADAKTKAREERRSKSEEFNAIIQKGEATTEVSVRIENALTEHAFGKSLESALVAQKVDPAKYYQFLRFDVGDILDTDLYAKQEHNKLN